MKKILSRIHRPARFVFIFGALSVIIMIVLSTLLYIGAGRVFDYYSAVDASEKLLAFSRPVSVGVCTGSLGIEYFLKHRENETN